MYFLCSLGVNYVAFVEGLRKTKPRLLVVSLATHSRVIHGSVRATLVPDATYLIRSSGEKARSGSGFSYRSSASGLEVLSNAPSALFRFVVVVLKDDFYSLYREVCRDVEINFDKA